MNKTLYVSDDDASVWEKAQQLAGGKLSSLVTDFLRKYVARKTNAARGYERIVIRLYEGGIPKAYAFHGRWIIPPEKPFTIPNNDFPDQSYAVAETLKHKFAFLSFLEDIPDPDGPDPYVYGGLEIVDSLENEPEHIPTPVIAETMKRMGIVVQELDI